jgi:hypothetical protein
MIGIAEFVRLFYGLRRRRDEDRPVPLSCRFVADEMAKLSCPCHRHLAELGVTYRQANRVLNKLTEGRAPVLVRGRDLERTGARTYLPAPPVDVEAAAEDARQVVEPAGEVLDDVLGAHLVIEGDASAAVRHWAEGALHGAERMAGGRR